MAATRRRRPTALAAAVATAVTLGATALTLPGAFAADAPKAAPAIDLKDGTLDWGVKESFRKYLLSPIANGKITAADGAKQAAGNGPFTFSGGTGSYDTSTHATRTTFGGSVHFEGHEGVLDIKLSDVKVTTTTTGGGISADVTTVTDGKAATDDDVVIADLSLDGVRPGEGPGGAMVYKDIPATLTEKGAKAFQGFYQAGSALDAATLSVTPDMGAPSEEPSENPSENPSGNPSGNPSEGPSGNPSEGPSGNPGEGSSGKPTEDPTQQPTATPSANDKPADGIVKGSLTWGLKESFRTYIASGGDATLADGAKAKNGVYDFPYESGTVDPAGEKADAGFGGSVRFAYKAHGIDMKFSDLRIAAKGATGSLTVDVTTPKGTANDVKFATLDLSKATYTAKNEVVVLDKVPAAFTEAGAAQFANDTTGSIYHAGQALDPVTVTLALSEDAGLPGGDATDSTGGATPNGGTSGSGSGFGTGSGSGSGTGTLASTGAGLPAGGLIGGAGAVVAAGAGAMFLARRRRTTRS